MKEMDMKTSSKILLTGSALTLMLSASWAEDQGKKAGPEGQHNGPFKGRFEALDKNSDGKISKDEFLLHFDEVDSNKDGQLSKEEMIEQMEKMREHDPKNRPHFEEQDLNKDGFLSKDEFKGPEGFFGKIDANQDGQISKDEMTTAKEKMQKFQGKGPKQGEERGKRKDQ